MNKWLVAFISLVISVVFAIVEYILPESINLFWATVIAIMTFIISYVFIELLECTKKLQENANDFKYSSFKRHGISEYHNKFTEINFGECIQHAKNIKMVLLYSKNTISGNISSLRNFLKKSGTSLEIIILENNRDNPSFQFISKKFGYSANGQLSEKLDEFKQTICNDLLPYKDEKSSVKLYSTDTIPMYTLYMFDDYAYITLYKTAPERTNLIPCFRVEKAEESSFYSFASNDFENLKARSQEILLS